MRYLLTYVLSGITFDKSYTRHNLNFNKRCVFIFIKKKKMKLVHFIDVKFINLNIKQHNINKSYILHLLYS